VTKLSTVVLLIRHGRTDAVGTRLVSRLPGVPLNAIGRAEVERLRTGLARERIDAVYASPLERTRETAAPLAADRATDVRPCDGLVEVEFGEWTGSTFSELDLRSDWRRFNEHRSRAIVPRGESAPDVQARVLACLRRLHDRHPGETIAAVSHADVIRAALLYYAGKSLDEWHQMDIAPASVSAVRLHADGGTILYINRQYGADA
jgi:broad specificity phosphatase PhoE